MNQPIPQYPEFCKFDITLKDYYNTIYNLYEPYSEYSFANLAIWLNLSNRLELSELNGNLLLKFDLPDNPGKYFYELYGTKKVDDSLKLILYNSDIKKVEALPEFANMAIKNKQLFDIQEDRDDWEYIYSTVDHSKMSGKIYFKNRYIIKKFMKDYGQDIKITEVNLSNYDEAKKLKLFYNKLNNNQFVNNNDESELESAALENTFKFAKELNPKCLILNIDNKVCGFVTFYLTHRKIALVNHLKADYKYKNIFDFLTYILASKLRTMGIDYFNYEQDLGIEGIRFHKMKLRPNKLLKKYTVSLKT